MANMVCVAWAVVVTVFFTFPTSFPVTGGNMSMFFFFFSFFFPLSPGLGGLVEWLLTDIDYASAVLGVMLILGIGNWFVHARSYYHGPRLE